MWIDGDRRTAPDGSSFAWQHWAHTFSYALAASADGWREAGFNAARRRLQPRPDRGRDRGGGGGRGDGAAALTLSVPNVTLSALKPHGNPLAAGRPGGAARADRAVTVRLRETEGMTSLVRVRADAALGGIEAAWRASLLEEEDDSGLPVSDGTALVGIGPFETVTAVLRLGPVPGLVPAAPAATAGPPPVPPVPPEPVQPVHARYWLHGKGPAPAGNVPVAVHVTPTRITLGGYSDGAGFGEGDPAVPLQLSVACGPEPASGAVELLVPDGLLAEIDGAPVTADAPLPFDIPGHGFTTWDVVVRARPGADAGRYFVAARIRDGLGQLLEDTALVTIGEPGAPDASQPPEELFFRLQSDVQGMADEADLEVLTPELRLAPGERGELTVRRRQPPGFRPARRAPAHLARSALGGPPRRGRRRSPCRLAGRPRRASPSPCPRRPSQAGSPGSWSSSCTSAASATRRRSRSR